MCCGCMRLCVLLQTRCTEDASSKLVSMHVCGQVRRSLGTWSHANHDQPMSELARHSACPYVTTLTLFLVLEPQICLEDAYTLVTVSCLHRLCISCSRLLVAQIKTTPLACPICRQHVKGFLSPTEVRAQPVMPAGAPGALMPAMAQAGGA